MISILQQKNGLVGRADAIEALSKKEKASILLVSDTHGRHDLFRFIVEKFGEQCDALCFCGDGIADLCRLLSQTQKSKTLEKCFPPVLSFVRGNGDYPTFPLDLEKEQIELRVFLKQTFKAAGMNILVTHGHSEGAYYGTGRLSQVADEFHADAVFYGHTHIAAREEQNLVLFANPGSVGHPRGGQKPSFAIVNFPGKKLRAEPIFFSIEQSFEKDIEFFPYVPEPYF